MNDLEYAMNVIVQACNDMTAGFQNLHTGIQLLATTMQDHERLLINCAREYPDLPIEQLLAIVKLQAVMARGELQ